jgi:hypothetical protein
MSEMPISVNKVATKASENFKYYLGNRAIVKPAHITKKKPKWSACKSFNSYNLRLLVSILAQ